MYMTNRYQSRKSALETPRVQPSFSLSRTSRGVETEEALHGEEKRMIIWGKSGQNSPDSCPENKK